MMKYVLNVGGLIVCIQSQIPLKDEIKRLKPFIAAAQSELPDITVHHIPDFPLELKECSSQQISRIMNMGVWKDKKVYFTRGGNKGYLAACVLKESNRADCCIDYKNYPHVTPTLLNVLRFLPFHELLLANQSVIFHASWISYGDNAVLFSGPSEIGKSTQADLWHQYEDAQVQAADRVVIHKEKNGFVLDSFIFDGNQPVFRSCPQNLSCIVFLGQSSENNIHRLSAKVAVRHILEQIIMTPTDQSSFSDALSMALELTEKIPVYQLECRPDQSAVDYLKNHLISEGIFI